MVRHHLHNIWCRCPELEIVEIRVRQLSIPTMGIDSQCLLHVFNFGLLSGSCPDSVRPRRPSHARRGIPAHLPLGLPRLFNLSDVLVLRMTAGLGGRVS